MMKIIERHTAAWVMPRAAAMIAERIGWRLGYVAAPDDCDHFELTTGEHSLLVAAVDEIPSPAMRAAARRCIARHAGPTAVLVLHPPFGGDWRDNTRAYAAWREPGKLIPSELRDATLAVGISTFNVIGCDGWRLAFDCSGWRYEFMARCRDEAEQA